MRPWLRILGSECMYTCITPRLFKQNNKETDMVAVPAKTPTNLWKFNDHDDEEEVLQNMMMIEMMIPKHYYSQE